MKFCCLVRTLVLYDRPCLLDQKFTVPDIYLPTLPNYLGESVFLRCFSLQVYIKELISRIGRLKGWQV